MIMPFLRLVTIYIVVILAAVLFFKRDSVMSLLGMSSGAEITETSASANEPVKIAEPAAEVTPPATAAETTPEAAPQPEAEATEQPSKYPTEETAQIVATPTPTAPEAETETGGNIQARLEEARQAYWKRDIAGAEARYKGLVNDAPDNADIKGELGNLYFSQRRIPEAAEMYHQAGLQLIKDGNTQQVMGLVGVLQNIAPEKAADLRNRLSQ